MMLQLGMVSGLCRYNAVTGEWLEDEVLIKMASQVSRSLSPDCTGLTRNFLKPTSVPVPSPHLLYFF